jgi:hypothetical protein
VNGDYLWDASGEPDPEIVRLEAALRPLRSVAPPPDPRAVAAARRRGWDWRPLAVAATVLLAIASALVPPAARPPGWALVWLSDGVLPRSERILREGEWLDTGERRARLEVGDIGEVRLEPVTRVSVVDAGRDAHRLSLAHGRLHATIWAPPGRFLVDTPAARAVDLGCEYTLEVADDGAGVLRVLTGWVGFVHRGVLSLVPAGASCRTRPGQGPGTPRFDSAREAFAAALDALDEGGAPESRRDALDRALAEARPRDALSLWHLLARLEPAERGRVFDRLAAFVPPPEGVRRDGVVAGDRTMQDLWWDELGLGSSEFWRMWTSGPDPGEAP